MKYKNNYIKPQENIKYDSLLKMPQWIRKRNEILKRDNHCCRSCGSKNTLQVHHRQYHMNQSTGMMQVPWNYSDKLLITLCNSCHELGHKIHKIPTYKI